MNAAALWLLVVVANAAPLAGRRLGPATAIDLGLSLPDGRRLFGNHKRWLGLILSILATAAAARLVGLPVETGIMVSGWAMAGDLAASLVKRRLGIPPGGSVVGLDQLPESLLPLLMVGRPALSWTTLALLSLAFMAFDLAMRRLYSSLRQQ